MTPETYFIREDYRPNSRMLTLDEVSGETYWSAANLRASYSYQYPVYRYASRLIAEGRLRSVIDVGCGVGSKLAILHRAHPDVAITGIDQPHAIEHCRRRHAFGQWYADDFSAPRAELSDVRADLVICADVIEHLADPDILIDYLKRRVSPTGRILLSTPERDRLRGPDCTTSPNRYHIREWNFTELEAYLEHHGLLILNHVMQFPVRIAPDRYLLSEIILRLLRGQHVKYNQVCLLGLEPGA
jgi:SAM-dependent methyltransferase